MDDTITWDIAFLWVTHFEEKNNLIYSIISV